jgi:hypothetical protein
MEQKLPFTFNVKAAPSELFLNWLSTNETVDNIKITLLKDTPFIDDISFTVDFEKISTYNSAGERKNKLK